MWVLGAKTYSSAVNTAAQEVIRTQKTLDTPRVSSSGIWEGNLAEMRMDRRRRRSH